MAYKTINITCKFRHVLFEKYRKDKPGFLIKCYVDRIGRDFVGVSGLPNNTNVFCPFCKNDGKETRIGRIGLVRGRPSVIINHGGVKRIRT